MLFENKSLSDQRRLKIFRSSHAYSVSNLPRFHAARNRKFTHIEASLFRFKRYERHVVLAFKFLNKKGNRFSQCTNAKNETSNLAVT